MSGAGQLLQRQLPPGYQEEWAQRLRQVKTAQAKGLRSAMVFRIGRELLALPTALFAMIERQAVIHRVPHRDPALLLGLAGIRGALLPCISLSHVLELSGDAGTSLARYGSRMAVVEMDGRWAFPVSEMIGVTRYDPAALDRVPTTVEHALHKFTAGLFMLNGVPVGLLDHELVFYTLKAGLA